MACIDSEFFVYVLEMTLDGSDREIHRSAIWRFERPAAA